MSCVLSLGDISDLKLSIKSFTKSPTFEGKGLPSFDGEQLKIGDIELSFGAVVDCLGVLVWSVA